jgi:cysteine desulfurase
MGGNVMNKIYLDHAATTQVDERVLEVMKPYFTEKFGNASSLHQYGQEAKIALDRSREIIAKKINAEPEEIIFTSGGTESDNLAIKGVAYANRKKGNHIITSKIEHPAVLNTCKYLEKQGFKLTYLDVDKEGFIDLKQLEKSIGKNTILISIMYANNEIGVIQNIGKIGEICRKHKILFHSDAVQSFTKIPIDVKKISIDLLSFSAHKIHGPKGVGALFVKKGVGIEALNHGGGHEFGLRSGTENVSGIVGFAKAVELVTEDQIEHMQKLRDKLIEGILKKIPDTQLNGPRGDKRLCNNVNIAFNFIEGEGLLMHLDMKGIAVSTGSACSSKELKASHVLTAIDLRPDIAHGSIRFSMGRENTEEEIDYTIESLIEIVQKLRNISPLVKRR